MRERKTIVWVTTMAMSVTLICTLLGEARATQANSKNLLFNPGFEILDRPDRPKFWSMGGGWSVDTEEPYEGKNSMRTTEAWSWLSQEIRVKPDQYYSFTAYVRSDIRVERKTNYQNAFLWLDYLDKKGKVIKEEFGSIYATSSWRVYGRVTLVPPETEKIRVKLGKRLGEGSVWFDEIELKPYSEDLLFNPGFEILDRPWGMGGGWSVDTEEPYEGKNSMRTTEAWSWLSQEIRVKPDQYYSFTAYVRSDIRVERKTNYQNAFLWLDYLDKKGKVIKEEFGSIYATSSWRVYGRVTLVPPETEKIRVKLGKRLGEGSVWFDEIELKPYSDNLLLNPDFEILDSQDRPVFWGAGRGWSLDTMQPYQGKNCMQGTEPWQQLWQLIPARSKNFFNLKVHLRSDITPVSEAHPENTVISLLCMDGKGGVIKREERNMIAPFFWREENVSIYTPVGTTAVKIVLVKRLGKGSLWVDDLQMRHLRSYLRIRVLRAILDDKPFFIFYFSVYLILGISLLRVVLKR